MILDKIVKHKKKEVTQLSVLEDVPIADGRFNRMLSENSLSIIAELKSKSPSAGSLIEHYDPVSIAKEYETGGANAISILTDETFFGGSMDDLSKVRKETKQPILCKDFIISKEQIYHARNAGADACLLIVAILGDKNLLNLHHMITHLGMTAVVEVFNEEELNRALKIGATTILINNRNLNDFSMNKHNVEILSKKIPKSIYIIYASGIEHPEEVKHISNRINAVLIGTALITSKDRIQFLRDCR